MCKKWEDAVLEKYNTFIKSSPALEHWGEPNMSNPFFKATVHVANEWEKFLAPANGSPSNAGTVEKAIRDAVEMAVINYARGWNLQRYLKELQEDIEAEVGAVKQSIAKGPVFQAHEFEVKINYNDRDALWNQIVWILKKPLNHWTLPEGTKGLCWALTFDWLKRMYKGLPVTDSTYNLEMLLKIQEELVRTAGSAAYTEIEMAAKSNLVLELVGEGTFDNNYCNGVALFQQMSDGCYYVHLCLSYSEIGHSLAVRFRDRKIDLCDQNWGIGTIDEGAADPTNGKQEYMKWHLEHYTRRRLGDLEHPDWRYTTWELYRVKGVTGQ
jgi:hypothetical protein